MEEKIIESGFKDVNIVSVDVNDYKGAGDCLIMATNSGVIEKVTDKEVREKLQSKLPSYMIPENTYF